MSNIKSSFLSGFVLKSNVLRIAWVLAGPVSFGIVMASCGSQSDSSTGAAKKIGSAEVVLLNAGSLQFVDSGIFGSGSIAFKNPVGEVKAKKNYALEFLLDDKASVKLVTHSNEKLENGFEFAFTRAGKTLQVVTTAEGKSVDISGAGTLSSIDATQKIKVFVDVHNDETPAHVLIWNQATQDPTEENAAYNSESAEGAGDSFNSPGNGAATFWGLVLSNANVTSAQIIAPKFVEK